MGDVHKHIPPHILCWQSRPATYVVTNDPMPIASLHLLSMATFLLILHLIIILLGSGIHQKSSKKLTLRFAAAEEEMNNNNNLNIIVGHSSNITSHSSNIIADDSKNISGPLSGKVSY